VDSDTASPWTETFSERIGDASWGIVGELLVGPEGWFVNGAWRVRVNIFLRSGSVGGTSIVRL